MRQTRWRWRLLVNQSDEALFLYRPYDRGRPRAIGQSELALWQGLRNHEIEGAEFRDAPRSATRHFAGALVAPWKGPMTDTEPGDPARPLFGNALWVSDADLVMGPPDQASLGVRIAQAMLSRYEAALNTG